MTFDPSVDLPAGAARIANHFPDVWTSYAGLGEACAGAGPLDEKTRRLIKLALVAIPTLGLPAAIEALAWIDDMAGDSGSKTKET